MRIRGRARRLRGGVLLPLAAVLGAGVVILPAVASSETTGTIEATEKAGIYKEFRWSPAEATVSAGNGLTLKNPSTEVSHGVEWKSGPTTPTCSAGVPVGNTEVAAGKSWSGTCTFAQPGKYEFWCTVHHEAMRAVITVNANGTTTTTSPPTTGSTTAPSGPSGGTQQGASESPGGGAASPLAGSAASAVKLAPAQRGGSVRGSVDVSAAGAGGRLLVELLAKSAALASGGHGARVRVGKLVLTHIRAGKVSFSVSLGSRARAALHRHHRLALTARLQIQAPGSAALTVTRNVTLHS